MYACTHTYASYVATILVSLFVSQIYKVYRGKCSREKTTSQCIPSQHSNPFYSTVVSLSSIFGRRGSSASVLTERRPSFQYGLRCSNVGVTSDKYNNNLAKKVHFCTPTHENNKNITINDCLVAQMSRLTEVGLAVSDDTLIAFEVQTVLYTEEPKPPNNILVCYRSTEV